MLTQITSQPACALYQLEPIISSNVNCFIASTPESRKICNDPFVVGIEYTNLLRDACASVLGELAKIDAVAALKEDETTVLHILRGGLNFGLRMALAQAYGWNRHVSAFLSAQRRRSDEDPEQWEIGERDYKKVYLPHTASIVFGDVVATGTSLQYAVDCLKQHLDSVESNLRSTIFFTIGGPRTEEILASLDEYCRKRFPGYESTSVVYLEGRFCVAEPETPMQIKITGTDLVRRDAVMAPEFIASQSEDPAYALERCTIYDAGSRAFWLPEYMEDVQEYWEHTLTLAEQGVSYAQLLEERFPEVASQVLEQLGSDISLRSVCEAQLKKCSE